MLAQPLRGAGEPSRDSVTFILADDHPMVRQGVRMMLEAEYSNSEVIEAADLDATLEAVVAHPGALLLIDLDMPGMSGVESLLALRQEFPHLVMAVLTGTADREVILDALNAGVNGYILKASPADELIHAITTVRGGRSYVTDALWRGGGNPAMAPTQTPQPALAAGCDVSPPTNAPRLSRRQREVLTWLMKGHSNKQIARDLNLGEGTVKIHLAAVFRALGAQNRTEAVTIAMRLQL